ncbi:hypothetical protein CYMTET_40707, partial [Cymbomonas tetramitiformis]
CLGLRMLSGVEGRVEYGQLLRTALAHDTPTCRCVATRALLDLALCLGPVELDQWLQPVGEASEADAEAAGGTTPGVASEELPLLKVLVRLIGGTPEAEPVEERYDLRAIAAEGAAKLLLFQRTGEEGSGVAEQLMAELLVAYFKWVDDEQQPHLAQCLAVFFPTYAGSAGAAQERCLCLAALPALRASVGAKHLPRLQQYLLHLLRLRPTDPGTGEPRALQQLLRTLLLEAKGALATCTKSKAASKAYIGACLKLAAGMPQPAPSEAARPGLCAALHIAEQLMPSLQEKALQKEAASVVERLREAVTASGGGTAEEVEAGLSHEELQDLAGEVQRVMQEQATLGGHFITTTETASVGSGADAMSGNASTRSNGRSRRTAGVSAPPTRTSHSRSCKQKVSAAIDSEEEQEAAEEEPHNEAGEMSNVEDCHGEALSERSCVQQRNEENEENEEVEQGQTRRSSKASNPRKGSPHGVKPSRVALQENVC